MDSIIERRSIRKYKAQEISKEQITQIIEAAIKAPSAKNRQPWKYLIYSDKAKKQLLDVMEQGLDKESEAHALLPKSAGGLADAYNTLRIMREAPVDSGRICRSIHLASSSSILFSSSTSKTIRSSSFP